MTLRLKDIATVSLGLAFRSRVKASPAGNVRIIQMRDLGKDNTVHLKWSMRIEQARPRPSWLARQGDIIFRSRGWVSTAALLREDAENTIVAAPLFRIRPDTKKVAPEFLLWWINQRSSQAYFYSRSRGTMIKMVSKQDLENLEVSLPPLKRQNEIAELFRLSMEEQRLLEKIKKRKATYMQGVLMQMVLESCPPANNKNHGFDAAQGAET